MKEKFPLTSEEFETIYAKVPRLTVEILIKSDKGIFLTKRSIEPCKGQWHLPGGTVYFGESLQKAVARIAKRELGITVKSTNNLGYIEYPSHYKNGLDHPIGIVFLVTEYTGTIAPNAEASNSSWFSSMPENMHADQDTFLKDTRVLE